MSRRSLASLVAVLLISAAPAAVAQTLTVEGNIVAGPRTLTQAELAELPHVEFTTTTEWTEGPTTFRGISGQALMRSLGAAGTKVVAYASDDYTAEIPLGDFETTPLLIADSMNGAPLPEDKGPLWIVYPYDAGYDGPEYLDRSTWALERLVVE